jgi:acyl carrier protein
LVIEYIGGVLEFGDFVSRLRSVHSGQIPESVTPYDNLYDELGFDSFQAFELLIVVESLAGNLVPPAEVPELYTLGDAHAYYEQLRVSDVDVVGP